jgi:hypothetical protein
MSGGSGYLAVSAVELFVGVPSEAKGYQSSGCRDYDKVLCSTSLNNSCFCWLSFFPRSVR